MPETCNCWGYVPVTKACTPRTHKPQLMSPCAVTTEVCALQLESSLHCLHLERNPRAATKTQGDTQCCRCGYCFFLQGGLWFLAEVKVSGIRVHTLPTVRGQRAGLASNELFGPGSSLATLIWDQFPDLSSWRKVCVGVLWGSFSFPAGSAVPGCHDGEGLLHHDCTLSLSAGCKVRHLLLCHVSLV